jgi:hypothetical protein
MKQAKRRLPALPSLEKLWLPLAEAVASTSYLPHPRVVRAVDSAVFPTSRKQKMRITPIESANGVVGMYDDNTTPRWALLWAHGFSGVSQSASKGWTFAHVWPSKDDRDSYTHLANLAMIPECFGSLTDKTGPVTHYLRWHAWQVYRWKPKDSPIPIKPPSYNRLEWQYFEPVADPGRSITEEFARRQCKRSAILRPLLRNE